MTYVKPHLDEAPPEEHEHREVVTFLQVVPKCLFGGLIPML